MTYDLVDVVGASLLHNSRMIHLALAAEKSYYRRYWRRRIDYAYSAEWREAISHIIRVSTKRRDLHVV